MDYAIASTFCNPFLPVSLNENFALCNRIYVILSIAKISIQRNGNKKCKSWQLCYALPLKSGCIVPSSEIWQLSIDHTIRESEITPIRKKCRKSSI